MAIATGNMDMLTTKVVKLRVAGHTFAEIAKKEDISPQDAVLAWQNYVETRMVMSYEEQRVLYLLRLEDFLKRCNDRLTAASKAEDFELILKTLDRIEAALALNEERKSEAELQLKELTSQQAQLVLTAIFSMQNSLQNFLKDALQGESVETIRGSVLKDFESNYLAMAQTALALEGQADG